MEKSLAPQAVRWRVMKGELSKTRGGLTKDHLTINKRGRVVSKKVAKQARVHKNLGAYVDDPPLLRKNIKMRSNKRRKSK